MEFITNDEWSYMIINIFNKKGWKHIDCILLNATNRSDVEKYNNDNNYICIYWSSWIDFKEHGIPSNFPYSSRIKDKLPYLFI